jgi:glycerophosphoryl diester phosphodiesterase
MADTRLAERFELQGHRGARGLKPENTLPSFETALDLEVSSIETDVHLTSDKVPVLCHDPRIDGLHYRLRSHALAPPPGQRPPISGMSFLQLRSYIADGNPDPPRFPGQTAELTPAARLYAEREGMDPFAIPRLADLFAFVDAYAGDLGRRTDKSESRRARAREICLDLELKRVAFYPQAIGDVFDGLSPALLEAQVLIDIRSANFVDRCRVRSFDHRSVRALKQAEPRIEAGVLIAETAPVFPAELARHAEASVYCPDFRFLDRAQVEQAHEAGVRVIPWTVNDPADWSTLLDWGIDGISTDFPDRLAALLRQRGIQF